MNISIEKLIDRLAIELIGKNVAVCFKEHDENLATLYFDFETNSFYCDNCGIKGTVVDLVIEYWDVDEELATRWLEDNFILRKKWLNIR